MWHLFGGIYYFPVGHGSEKSCKEKENTYHHRKSRDKIMYRDSSFRESIEGKLLIEMVDDDNECCKSADTRKSGEHNSVDFSPMY